MTSSCEAACRLLCQHLGCQSAHLHTCLQEAAELFRGMEEPCDMPTLPAMRALQAVLHVILRPCLAPACRV